MRVCADMHVGLCECGTSSEGGKGKGCLLTVGHETPPPQQGGPHGSQILPSKWANPYLVNPRAATAPSQSQC